MTRRDANVVGMRWSNQIGGTVDVLSLKCGGPIKSDAMKSLSLGYLGQNSVGELYLGGYWNVVVR